MSFNPQRAIAEKRDAEGRVLRRYALAHDEKGYYWDGLECASW
jgi:hypothetical protein